MDLRSFMTRFAQEVGGEYNEYAPELFIIIVPVSGGRAQTVVGEIRFSELYNRKILVFSSKVCPAGPELDYRSVLTQSSFLAYSRFAVIENYLQVQAGADYDTISDTQLKEMIREVANIADNFEMKLTGVDVQ